MLCVRVILCHTVVAAYSMRYLERVTWSLSIKSSRWSSRKWSGEHAALSKGHFRFDRTWSLSGVWQVLFCNQPVIPRLLFGSESYCEFFFTPSPEAAGKVPQSNRRINHSPFHHLRLHGHYGRCHKKSRFVHHRKEMALWYEACISHSFRIALLVSVRSKSLEEKAVNGRIIIDFRLYSQKFYYKSMLFRMW